MLIALCCRIVFVFVCHASAGGGTRHLLLFFFFFLLFCSFSVSLPFSCFSQSTHQISVVVLAFVCRTCRIQYDGRSLHCLLCWLHYNVPWYLIVSVSWSCDHRACVSVKIKCLAWRKNRHGHWLGVLEMYQWHAHTHHEYVDDRGDRLWDSLWNRGWCFCCLFLGNETYHRYTYISICSKRRIPRARSSLCPKVSKYGQSNNINSINSGVYIFLITFTFQLNS